MRSHAGKAPRSFNMALAAAMALTGAEAAAQPAYQDLPAKAGSLACGGEWEVRKKEHYIFSLSQPNSGAPTDREAYGTALRGAARAYISASLEGADPFVRIEGIVGDYADGEAAKKSVLAADEELEAIIGDDPSGREVPSVYPGWTTPHLIAHPPAPSSSGSLSPDNPIPLLWVDKITDDQGLSIVVVMAQQCGEPFDPR